MRNDIRVWARALAIAIVAVPVLSLASDLSTPNTFSPGTLIHSAQINANFAAVQAAVNSKQDAIQAGNCAPGMAIVGIAADGGAVTCGAASLAFGFALSGTAATSGLTVSNDGGGAALEGDNTSPYTYLANIYGVFGHVTSAGPSSSAVYGQNDSEQGTGVYGNSNATYGYGVVGAAGLGGIGVYGTNPSGDAIVGDAVNGAGVRGRSETASTPGVIAHNSTATGAGLDIDEGYLQVKGLGPGTNGNGTSTTAFLVVSETGVNSGGTDVLIDNPMTNENGNLMLIVTPTLYFNGVSYAANTGPIAVNYNPTQNTSGGWYIRQTNGSLMPNNCAFNVLVISP